MSRRGSEKKITAGFQERAEALVGLISERDAAISALEYEVRRLTIELQKQTKVWDKTPSVVSDSSGNGICGSGWQEGAVVGTREL